MIKMLVLDIGGTLITDNNQITSKNIKAINYCKSKGINIVLATARMYSSTKYISYSIGLDYGVFGNGSHLMNMAKKETIYKNIMNRAVVKEIIDYAKQKNIYVHLNEEFSETSEELDYFTLKHLNLNKLYPINLKSNINLVDNLTEYLEKNVDILKVILVSEKSLTDNINNLERDILLNRAILTENCSNLYESAINKTINYAEFGNGEDTKYNGILKIAELLRIKKEEIMVIGDGLNDMEMIEGIPLSICMTNGNEFVKKKALYITTNDNNNSGVAEAIYKYIK